MKRPGHERKGSGYGLFIILLIYLLSTSYAQTKKGYGNEVKNTSSEKKAFVEEGRRLLQIPETIFKSGQDYSQDSKVLLDHRKKLAGSSRNLTDFFGDRRMLLERLGQEPRLGDSVGSKD
jgi:hypothetical protein